MAEKGLEDIEAGKLCDFDDRRMKGTKEKVVEMEN